MTTTKKFGLLKFHSGYEKFNLNSPKGYSRKIINAQTDDNPCHTSEDLRASFRKLSRLPRKRLARGEGPPVILGPTPGAVGLTSSSEESSPRLMMVGGCTGTI